MRGVGVFTVRKYCMDESGELGGCGVDVVVDDSDSDSDDGDVSDNEGPEDDIPEDDDVESK